MEETDTYSVATYANIILNDEEYASSYSNPDPNKSLENLRALARALLAYGDHANAYFDANATALDTPAVEIPAEYAEDEAYYSTNGLPEGVTFEGATLSLKSQTTLSLYFGKTANVSDVVLTMDGKTADVDYETKQSGNEYVIRIRNIAAAELDTAYLVKVNETGTFTYCPLTYCYKAQTNSNTKLANIVKALYNYWLASKQYFNKEAN